MKPSYSVELPRKTRLLKVCAHDFETVRGAVYVRAVRLMALCDRPYSTRLARRGYIAISQL